MPQRNKQSFLHGALILSAAAILNKIVGALFFKIPLQRINNSAYGYFEAVYNIYIPIYIVSTAGFPVAVSRMVSQSLALGRYRDIRAIKRVVNRVFLLTGSCGMLAMVIASFFYPDYVGMPNIRLTMLVMAPSVFFCCIATAYRGIYEGSRNMIPTAISQTLEAIGKLLFGLALAAGALHLGQWQFEHGFKVFGKTAETAQQALDISLPYIAAGGMVGVTAGSLFSFSYLLARYRRFGSGISKQELESSPPPYPVRSIFRMLLKIAFPIAIGTLATELTTMIDVVSLQKSLAVVYDRHGDIIKEIYSGAIAQSRTNDVLAFLTGNRGIAMTFVNLVPNITLTFGISALPVITSAWALKDKKQLRKMVSTVLRITVMVALPAGLGLSVLAKPILNLIYEPHNVVVAGPQLQVLGLAVVFICLVAPINAMLQAIGRADVPAKIVLVGGAVKLVLNVLLIQNPNINIMGSAYSTLACYIVMVVLSLYSLFKVVKARIYWKSAFLKPLIASILCIATAWAVNGLLARVVSAKLAVVIAIAAAVIVYLLALLWIKAIKREDVLMLPKGQKIAQILEKYDWIG